jgi:O-antigen/teichoic acid export membrane protein
MRIFTPDWLRTAISRYLIYIVSSFFGPASNVLFTLIAVRYIASTEIGQYQKVLIVGSYISVLQFGIFSVVARDLPALLSAGNQASVERLLRSSLGAVRLMALCSAVATIGLAFYTYGRSGFTTECGLYISLFLGNHFALKFQWLDAVARGHGRFRELGIIMAANGVVSLLLALSPIIVGDLSLALRVAVAPISVYLIGAYCLRFCVIPELNLRTILSLVKTGLPLFLAGIIFTYLQIADRSISALYLTSDELGKYSISIMIATIISVVPNPLSAILVTKIGGRYGKTRVAHSLRPYIGRGLLINGLVLGGIGGIFCFAPRDMYLMVFPGYGEGIEAARVVAASAVLMSFVGPSSIITVLDKNWGLIAILAISLVVVWLVGFQLSSSGIGLMVGPYSRLAGFIMCFTLVVAYCFRITDKKRGPNEL